MRAGWGYSGTKHGKKSSSFHTLPGKPVTKHLAVSSEQCNEPPHMETPGEITGTVGC